MPIKTIVPITTAVIGVAAIAATTVPWIGCRLVYDRSAIAGGEVWRIVTGHLYHYSVLHLVCNLLPFLAIGLWIEMRTRSGWRFAFGTLLTAAAIGSGLFVSHRDMALFGGLSGIDCGMACYLGLIWHVGGGRAGVAGRALLVVLFAKIAYEVSVGDALLADRAGRDFKVVPLAHFIGCLSAWGLRWMPWMRNRRREKTSDRYGKFSPGRRSLVGAGFNSTRGSLCPSGPNASPRKPA